MLKNSTRLLAATFLVCAGALTTAGLAQADDPDIPPDGCPQDMWCIYDGQQFDGQWIPAPSNGDLDFADWDKVSSGVNRTSNEICFYDYDSTGVGHIVAYLSPGSGFLNIEGTRADNSIDTVTSHPYDASLEGAMGCDETLPPVSNPDGAPPPWV